MIRIRFKELLAEREFTERRVITLIEVAAATGIHRTTLGKISNQPGYNCGIDSLDSLCRYFNCRLDELAQYVPDTDPPSRKPVATPTPKLEVPAPAPELSVAAPSPEKQVARSDE